MCSIIGSFNKKKLKELVNFNLHRGNSTFSVTEYNINSNNIKNCNKILDKYNEQVLDQYQFEKDIFYIIHIQAPTSSEGVSEDNIHPAYYKKYGYYLWHNGIILQKDMDNLTKKYYNTNIEYKWDTQLLLNLLSEHGFEVLNIVEGCFSCIFYKNKNLYLFRTTSCPLYIDKTFNISSTIFKGSSLIEPGKVFIMDFEHRKIIEKCKFTCKDNPYLI